jgi:hypothetical protein
MAKNVHANVLDAALNYIKNNSNRISVLTAEPTGGSAYSNATTDHDSSGFRMATKTITASDFTGPAAGDVSGRKITVNKASSMSIDGITGAVDATHVSLINLGSSGFVTYTTTCTTQSLTAGNKVNTPAWAIEIRNPT